MGKFKEKSIWKWFLVDFPSGESPIYRISIGYPVSQKSKFLEYTLATLDTQETDPRTPKYSNPPLNILILL